MYKLIIQDNILTGYEGDLPEVLHIPEGITVISKNCFKESNIKRVFLPNSIEIIGESAFENCIELLTVYIYSDANLKELKDRSFYHCLKLFKIGPSPFHPLWENFYDYSMPELVCFQLPLKLSHIGDSVFEGCVSISTIEIPGTISELNSSCFANCKKLESFTWKHEGNPYSISYGILDGCDSLKEVFTTYHPSFFNDFVDEIPNIKYIHNLNGTYDSLDIQHERRMHEMFLHSMSVFYNQLGMNLTQMKRTYYGRRNKYKDPIMANWEFYTNKKLSFTKLKDWKQATGIGLILGYNNYRALDVDFGFGVELSEEQKSELIKTFCNYLGLNSRDAQHSVETGNGKEDDVEDCYYIIDDDAEEYNDTYDWVVISGSGRGFHIIFKCQPYTDEYDTISFDFSKKVTLRYTDKFSLGTIELRWKDHIVLPPSKAQYGGQYRFYKEKLPKGMPKEISLPALDNLLYNVASEHKYDIGETFSKYKYEIAYWQTIYNPDDSWREPRLFSEVPNGWLEKSNTDNARNILLLRYLRENNPMFESYAKEVLFNCVDYRCTEYNEGFSVNKFNFARKDLYFNLASLISVKIIKGSIKSIDYLYKRLVDSYNLSGEIEYNDIDIKELTEYQEHFKHIDENAKALALEEGELYLFVDTETTGLPVNPNTSYENAENWPRLVQISWIVSDKNGLILRNQTYTIYPKDFTIPVQASKVHGIYQNDAEHDGEELCTVLENFINDLKQCDYIVGHNISYDVNIILAEMKRQQIDYATINKMLHIPQLCTMKLSVNLCHILAYRGFKYPTLQELYKKLFGKTFEDAHNANADIKATYDCFWKLKEKGYIR